MGEGVEGGGENILVPLSRDKQTENFVSPEAQGRESSFFQSSVPYARWAVAQTAMLSLQAPDSHTTTQQSCQSQRSPDTDKRSSSYYSA